MWWKETVCLIVGLSVVLVAVGTTTLFPKPEKAQASESEALVFVGKTPVDGTYQYLHHYRSKKDGTNCFVLVTESVAKTAQHVSCVRN